MTRIPAVITDSGKLSKVPNQPKTPLRHFRASDELYLPAKRLAKEQGRSMSDVLREALAKYVEENTEQPDATES